MPSDCSATSPPSPAARPPPRRASITGRRSSLLTASACARSRPRSLAAFLHLDDLVGDRTVRLTVHGRRGLLARRLDQTEHLAGALVEPVPEVVHPVLVLDGQVLAVRVGHLVLVGAFHPVVYVEIQRHRESSSRGSRLPASPSAAARRGRCPARSCRRFRAQGSCWPGETRRSGRHDTGVPARSI